MFRRCGLRCRTRSGVIPDHWPSRASLLRGPGDPSREAGYPAAVEDAWRPDKTRLDTTDQKALADVEEYGWHCLHVHDRDGLPQWTFSIGIFQTWHHPELLVFGLRDTVAHDLLKRLVLRVANRIIQTNCQVVSNNVSP